MAHKGLRSIKYNYVLLPDLTSDSFPQGQVHYRNIVMIDLKQHYASDDRFDAAFRTSDIRHRDIVVNHSYGAADMNVILRDDKEFYHLEVDVVQKNVLGAVSDYTTIIDHLEKFVPVSPDKVDYSVLKLR